jgi:hypothetical protein
MKAKSKKFTIDVTNCIKLSDMRDGDKICITLQNGHKLWIVMDCCYADNSEIKVCCQEGYINVRPRYANEITVSVLDAL